MPDQLLGDLRPVDGFFSRVVEDVQADGATEKVPGDRIVRQDVVS